jgi:hypothetical protein
MKHALIATAGVILLTACQPEQELHAEPGNNVPRITTFSGGTFSGFTQTDIYADDSAKFTNTTPFGKTTKVTRLSPRAGRYSQAYAVARPLITKHRVKQGDDCMDYGSDSVTITQNGKTQSVSATCPDNTISAAINAISKTLADDAN